MDHLAKSANFVGLHWVPCVGVCNWSAKFVSLHSLLHYPVLMLEIKLLVEWWTCELPEATNVVLRFFLFDAVWEVNSLPCHKALEILKITPLMWGGLVKIQVIFLCFLRYVFGVPAQQLGVLDLLAGHNCPHNCVKWKSGWEARFSWLLIASHPLDAMHRTIFEWNINVDSFNIILLSSGSRCKWPKNLGSWLCALLSLCFIIYQNVWSCVFYGSQVKERVGFIVSISKQQGTHFNLHLLLQKNCSPMWLGRVWPLYLVLLFAEILWFVWQTQIGKLGTLMGVFVPCLQNILGIIFYIRFTWWVVFGCCTMRGFCNHLQCCTICLGGTAKASSCFFSIYILSTFSFGLPSKWSIRTLVLCIWWWLAGLWV